jgi:anti-sigma factor RsiW
VAEHELSGLRCSEVLELSGAFVLNALSPAEAEAVRRHVASCPEAHAEIMELGSVVPALFETTEPVEPPAGLKGRILAAAAAEQAAMGAPEAVRPTAADATDRAIDRPRSAAGTEPVLGDGRRTGAPFPAAADAQRPGFDFGAFFRRPIWAGVAAAAFVAAIALGAWSLQLRTEIDGLTAYRNGVVEVLEEAARDGAQLAVLTAPEDPAGPTGLAAVGADGSVAMVMRDLEPTTGTEVYEAWLIGAEGTPIPIGSFQVDDSRTASFTTARASLGPGVTVALSLEPRAGATTPTVVVAVGAAQGQSS